MTKSLRKTVFASIRKNAVRTPAGAIAIALLLWLVPLFIKDAFTLQVILLAIMFGALGAAWNLVGGFLGRVSFGHGVFIGVGAYTTLLLLRNWNISAILGLPASALAAAAVAFLIGRPTLRLAGHYFAMATIGLLQIALLLVTNWEWTGGAVGVEAPLEDAPGMLLFADKTPYYLIGVGLALATFLVTYLLVHSKIGYYWRAINGDESAARSLGVPADRYKMVAFVVSAAITGIWGGFFGLYIGFIDPDSMFSMTTSVQIVLVAILGGVGSLIGPWLGAALLLPLSEGTHVLWGGSGSGSDLLIFGLAILFVALFLPAGLVTLRKYFGIADR